MNAEFIRTCALYQLSFGQFRPYATSFPRLFSLTLIPKSKKILEASLNLTPLLKTSLDARSRVLFRKWIIWKIGAVILFKRDMAEKDILRAHMLRSLDYNFSFCTDFLRR